MNHEHEEAKRRRKHGADRGPSPAEEKGAPPREDRPSFSAAWMPRADARETDAEYILEVALPGVLKEDVKVEVKGDVLTVSGERKTAKEEPGRTWLRREAPHGPFLRAFSLPEGLHTEDVKASFKDGVLTLSLRKPPEFKSRGTSVRID
ncbi:MAG: Hsp20/alpha crystallin family protein [Elusimicrobia bacterium]|nr:Hsp20/alpha crystallin family protein [Elusimicrobiota bacterium]